ncbi:MAG TPA: phosphoribosylaminoimidazolesuccinocarboxamide synthase [Streptosporangiaceae bacterium]|nr:phosphoribosylaminoimidazolesuccinocarboxamide synthase [Streptosporangiaceae bacterium]
MTTLTTIEAPGFRLFRRGKVRDTFELPDGTLLMVASDRISAFDVVLPTAIPGKGAVLTQMSRWWFGQTSGIVPSHLRADPPASVTRKLDWQVLGPRSMRVALAERIDIECVVRGYLAGSGWQEYRDAGTLAGERLAPGLRESSRLPEPRFTPAVKNDAGHDENISRARLAELAGAERAAQLEAISLALYGFAAGRCEAAGMILVDTKFEFGLIDGQLTLIDEVLTPDSSRFWETAQWREGRSMPSFDKQPVRDWLASQPWDKTAPGPELPAEIVARTSARYAEAARRICGLDMS